MKNKKLLKSILFVAAAFMLSHLLWDMWLRQMWHEFKYNYLKNASPGEGKRTIKFALKCIVIAAGAVLAATMIIGVLAYIIGARG